MKRFVLSILLLLLIPFSVIANETQQTDSTIGTRPLLVDEMPNAIVHQSNEVRMLLDNRINGSHMTMVEMDGYRLQIFSSNRQQQAKLEAEQIKQTLEKEIDIPIYILSDQPFWKVRLGNFRTISEASTFKEEFIQRFPQLQSSTYVVRDKIQVKQ